MHELSLSKNIVELVVERARQEGLTAITRIVLEVGVAAGVEADALRFCFDSVATGTLASGAALHIEAIGLRGRCTSCGREFEPRKLADACPHCGSHAADLLTGRELRVKSFDGV